MKIQRITGRQVFDSRGNLTVEAQVVLEDGSSVIGIAPSGASTGSSEALELRDGDPDRFAGKSVFRAVDHITSEISPCLQGRQVAEQRALDELMIELDGTRNLSRLGANAVVAVSMALARVAAQSQGRQLYESLGEAPAPSCRCRRSRSSVVACENGSTSRTSWSSLLAPRPIARAWR
ncbi:MAG: hypothetical protein VCF24_14530 [Candidatus Latescibacterota bacterium]